MGNTFAKSSASEDMISDFLPWINDTCLVLQRAPTRTVVVKQVRDRKKEDSRDEEDPESEKEKDKN